MDFTYLEVQHHPSKQIEALLKDNVIGTPGLSMLYQHLGVEQKLYSIAKPHFVVIQRKNSLIATCCFCERNFQGTVGFYVRYFAFTKGFRIKGAPQLKGNVKASGIREEISSILKGQGLLLPEQTRFFFYAYLDPRNPRSANVCEEFGFVPIRKYTTRLFSRIFLRDHPTLDIKQISSSAERIRTLLTSFYSNYNHFNTENLNNIYYYVEDGRGDILAGVQVNPDAWRVLTLPGNYGKTLLEAFDRTPFLSRLLSKNLKFLAVEGMYCKPGESAVFEKLLETLLYKHQVHTAIMVVDTASSLYTLTQQLNLGMLAKISPEVHGHVIANFQGVSEAFVQQQKDTPSYISVHDLS